MATGSCTGAKVGKGGFFYYYLRKGNKVPKKSGFPFFPSLYLYALDQSHSSPRVVVARRDALKMEKGERVIVGRGGKGGAVKYGRFPFVFRPCTFGVHL